MAANTVDEEKTFPVVGVGASAGGLKAFQQFISGLSKKTGAAYVLIQHLEPTRESLLTELLKKNCPLPVKAVDQSMPLQPGRLYVIMPNSELLIEKGNLLFREPTERHGFRTPIDVFFRSLARDQREMAVGCILSGTGSDGASGLKEIKAVGGMTLAQLPEQAEFSGMPRSAIAGDAVDLITVAESMGLTIDRYFDHKERSLVSAHESEGDDPVLPALLSLLRSRTGHDFRGYKDATISRRISRRQDLLHLDSLADYLKCLREKPDEVTTLAQDLLISVGAFFRDPEIWEKVEQWAIPEILDHRNPSNKTLRAWVPGGASGEEAYTVAMLLTEAVETRQLNLRIQVYSTDINNRALEFARKGIYSACILEDVGKDRLERFFEPAGEGTYRISEAIRERVVFASHNLMRDPPFSNLDLVSCRNLLNHLNEETQERIIPFFYFAIRDSGILVLGNSEGVSRHRELFKALSKPWPLFRRVPGHNVTHTFAFGSPDMNTNRPPSPTKARQRSESVNYEYLTRCLLTEHLRIGCLLVDHEMKVLYQRGDLDPYLAQPEGVPSANLLKAVRRGLRSTLGDMYRVCLNEEQVVKRDCTFRPKGGNLERVAITARLVSSGTGESNQVFITFEKRDPNPEGKIASAPDGARRPASAIEKKLRQTREELAGTIEDLETANEELKTSNEEIMSINDELQRSKQEMETSKEELQSLIEELSTLNNQFEARNEELAEANDDLTNLLRSTEFAVVFLDRQSRVKRFTRVAADLFHLIDSDLGRPLWDLTSRIEDKDLVEDSRIVLETLETSERQVCSESGKWYLRRILPYRTGDDRIEGVVITYNDVTQLKHMEIQLKESEAFWRRLFMDAPLFIAVMKGPDHRYIFENEYHRRMTGNRNVKGKPLAKAFPELEGTGIFERFDKVYRTGEPEMVPELSVKLHVGNTIKDGQYSQLLQPWFDKQGTVAGVMSIAFDITEQVEARRNLKASEAFFRLAIQCTPIVVFRQDSDLKYTWIYSKTAKESSAEVIGKTDRELFPEVAEELDSIKSQVIRDKQPRSHEYCLKQEGQVTTWLAFMEPAFDQDGEVNGLVGAALDISDRIAAENELKQAKESAEAANKAKTSFLTSMSHDIRTPLTAILGFSEILSDMLEKDQKEIARNIHEACEHLMGTLDSVLQLARLEGRQTRMECSTLSLFSHVEKTLSLYKSMKTDKHLTLTCDVPDDDPVMVEIDPDGLNRILSNLLGNALKFTGKDGHIEVCVRRNQAGNPEIVVQDDGPGIHPDYLDRIFDAFVQERGKEKTSLGGSGLGLAICRQLVEMMGGTIRVESEHGEGTRFFVELQPGRVAPASEDSGKVQPEKGTSRNKSGPRVVVCDDHSTTCDVVKLMLPDLSIRFVGDPDELMDHIKGAEVLLLDIEFHGKNLGQTILQQLRERKDLDGLRVVAFTAHGLPGQPEEFLRAGFDDYLAKPFTRKTLTRAIFGESQPLKKARE